MIDVYKHLNSLSSQIINDILKLRKNIAIEEIFFYLKAKILEESNTV